MYAFGQLDGSDNPAVIFRGIVGSRAYGTATPESDTDLRGVCVYKQDVVLNGKCGPVARRKFVIDRDIPIFHSPEAEEWWHKALDAPPV